MGTSIKYGHISLLRGQGDKVDMVINLNEGACVNLLTRVVGNPKN